MKKYLFFILLLLLFTQVFFVDFGEETIIELKDLRHVMPDFLNLPCQAIMVKLYNCMVDLSKDMDKAKEYSTNRFLLQGVWANIKYVHNSYLEAALTKKDGQDLGDQIIRDGYGVRKQEGDYYFPSSQLFIPN